MSVFVYPLQALQFTPGEVLAVVRCPGSVSHHPYPRHGKGCVAHGPAQKDLVLVPGNKSLGASKLCEMKKTGFRKIDNSLTSAVVLH